MAALARALQALADVGLTLSDDQLEVYGRAAEQVAAADVAGVPRDTTTAAVTTVVLGTVLREPVLLALRRLAQESQARRQWGG